jgi:hypothetical protein
MGRLNVCTRIEGYLQLRDEVVQVVFKTLWKRSRNLIEGQRRLVEL